MQMLGVKLRKSNDMFGHAQSGMSCCLCTAKQTLSDALNDLATCTASNLPYVLLHQGDSGNRNQRDFTSSTSGVPANSQVKSLVSLTSHFSDSLLAIGLGLNMSLGVIAGAVINKDNLIYLPGVIGMPSIGIAEILVNSSTRIVSGISYAGNFVGHLMDGNGEPFYDTNGLADLMYETDEIKRLTGYISEGFSRQMLINRGDFTAIQIQLPPGYTLPSFGGLSNLTLKTLVGGTQELTVTLISMLYDIQCRNWYATIAIELRDNFAVSESDITHASPLATLGIPGMAAMWTLQNQRGKKPFVTVFRLSFITSGRF